MTLTIELTESKIRRIEERAKRIGISSEEFAGKIMEFIADASEEDFESWVETFEILLDKDFMKTLKEGIKQAEEGNLIDWEKAKRELEIS